MKKQWTDANHVGKIAISILNTLSKEFHIEAKKSEEDRDIEKMIKISGSVGYQAQQYSNLQKNHEFAKRLEVVEHTMSTADAETLAMGQSPVIIAELDQRVNSELKKQATFT